MCVFRLFVSLSLRPFFPRRHTPRFHPACSYTPPALIQGLSAITLALPGDGAPPTAALCEGPRGLFTLVSEGAAMGASTQAAAAALCERVRAEHSGGGALGTPRSARGAGETGGGTTLSARSPRSLTTCPPS